jgi:hypothetical protein
MHKITLIFFRVHLEINKNIRHVPKLKSTRDFYFTTLKNVPRLQPLVITNRPRNCVEKTVGISNSSLTASSAYLQSGGTTQHSDGSHLAFG